MADNAVSFVDCLSECIACPEFIIEFNRLTGSKLGQSLKRSRLDRMIDEACRYSGESDEDMARFVNFVYEVVYLRLKPHVYNVSSSKGGQSWSRKQHNRRPQQLQRPQSSEAKALQSPVATTGLLNPNSQK
jgi:hypothetical protein